MAGYNFFKLGKVFFAFSILAIGIIHIVTASFSAVLFPLPPSSSLTTVLSFTSGAVMAIAGALMLTKKYAYSGAVLAGIILLLFLLALHLPILLHDLHNSGQWTASCEVFELFSGALILAGGALTAYSSENGKIKNGATLITTGRVLFATGLIAFGILDYLYGRFIRMLVPAWMAWRLFWSYFILIAFVGIAISFLIQKQVRLAALLLGLMFFIWMCLLHLPGVISNPGKEAGWTSLFIALAMSGVALLLSGDTSWKAVIKS